MNRKDRFGKNVFEGGFLGFWQHRRLRPQCAVTHGGHLEQADGTAWMAVSARTWSNSPPS